MSCCLLFFGLSGRDVDGACECRGLVGFLGFQHDRGLALKALALSASKSDVHGIFSALVLMTYHGVVLLLGGWQADEEGLVKLYKGLVDRCVFLSSL